MDPVASSTAQIEAGFILGGFLALLAVIALSKRTGWTTKLWWLAGCLLAVPLVNGLWFFFVSGLLTNLPWPIAYSIAYFPVPVAALVAFLLTAKPENDEEPEDLP